MRRTSSIVYIAIDSLIPPRGRSIPGLDQFTATLDQQGIPAIWLTSRSRLQFDEPRRRHGHTHPFIAEDGSAVYLPEGYFHLRPGSTTAKPHKAATIRRGRFTCIPVAEALPAAAEALEILSEDLGLPVVTLRSLSPRELVQNTGLPQPQAELARQRDFDEFFFFTGSSVEDIDRFLAEGRQRKLLFRQHGVLWSIAIGASVERCIHELSMLYDRALRYHAHIIGMATQDLAPSLFPFCERTLLLSERESRVDSLPEAATHRSRRVLLHAENVWERALDALAIP